MFWEEVLYGCSMVTMIMKVGSVGRQVRRVATHWVMNVVADGILWIGVLMAASGFGLLLEAIVDTMRYGHPR